MLNGIRHIISGNRKRLVSKDFDLDLSYITDRIIATSYPSSGIEGLYRNTYQEVKRFLEKHHLHHYKVYNLRSEKGYTNDVFHLTATFGFKDHNAPALRTVIQFCEDASDYLAQHPENVVVVHCKAGKGRTGVMVAALLLKLKVVSDPYEAMQIYAQRRTHDGRGITIPSQRRYVLYYDSYLQDPWSVKNREILISKIIMTGRQRALNKDDSCMICIKLPNESRKTWYTPSKTVSKEAMELTLEDEVIVESDFTIVVWRTRVGYKKKLLAFSLHAHFVEPNLIINKSDLDFAVNDNKCILFDSNFQIQLCIDYL
ncbi:putative phosphatidylinositol-3,4,5-trisphosphate 3-phosphatase [Umbelopsis sp. PMI_123]|nr:putative phosphatidylinositol-3,4,5-trisphosphate 3-phosphatase [Umbelopsis sp. PMI_123]